LSSSSASGSELLQAAQQRRAAARANAFRDSRSGLRHGVLPTRAFFFRRLPFRVAQQRNLDGTQRHTISQAQVPGFSRS